MTNPQERLCPPWVALSIAATVVITLAASWPRPADQARMLARHPASPVSVAYLEAWLLVRPDSPDHLDSLAMQYLELGRWSDALEASRRLALSSDNGARQQRAQFLSLAATQGETASLPGSPRSRDQHTSSHDHTAQAVWQARLADAAMKGQAFEAAARSYFIAADLSEDLAHKRHYFQQATQALQAADKVGLASTEAAQWIGDLVDDTPTLRHVLTLARQADQRDLVVGYARRLTGLANRREALPVQTALDSSDPAATTVHQDAHSPEETYDIAYQAFVESGALEDAIEVAQLAIAEGADNTTWHARLATVAQWDDRPELALTHWYRHAELSDNPDAWQQVMELALEQDDDESWLAAWQHRQVMLTDSSQDSQAHSNLSSEDLRTQALNALLAIHMRDQHWSAILRVLDQLQEQPDTQPQHLLVLRLTALEQHSYDFEEEDPRRSQARQALHQALKQSVETDWDIATMAWLAEKSRHAGRVSVASHYYGLLAQQDTERASHWYHALGKHLLSAQEYEHAAQAYFDAQSHADSVAKQALYFRAALDAFVEGDDVEQACVEAEERAGDLLDDAATVRYLIDLARQAQRTDLMSRYARRLIQLRQQDQTSMHEGARSGQPAVHRPTATQTAQTAMWPASAKLPIQPIAATATNTQDDDLEVAFKAFLEGGQLDDAVETAREALDRDMERAVWVPRLAQVAEWNNDPGTALRYWLTHARHTDDAQAWDHVLRLSTQRNDTHARLSALKHQSEQHPDDETLLDDIAQAYEQIGRPEDGMAYFLDRAHGPQQTAMLEQYAGMAIRSGDDAAATRVYQQLLDTGTAPHVHATELASLLYAQGDAAAALSTLRDVRDEVGSDADTAPYWQLYSELARAERRGDEAIRAHKQLLATGKATDTDLFDMMHLYGQRPLDGGRIAETFFKQESSPAALQTALQMYTQARSWQRIEHLLNNLTDEQRSYFLHSSSLLNARANYYGQTQQWDKAVADWRAAITMPDVTYDIKINFLWALIEFGTESELRHTLHDWRAEARTNADLWGPFAAAELRLGNAERALRYLSKQRMQHGDDPLWLMTLADAEESAGHTSRAWTTRRQALKQLNRKQQQLIAEFEEQNDPTQPNAEVLFSPDKSTARDQLAQQAVLVAQLVKGDPARHMLQALLTRENRAPESHELARSLLGDTPGLPDVADASPKSSDQDQAMGKTAKDVALAWALSGEHHDWAKAWLARQYADHLLTPAEPRLALALEDNDQPELVRLLDDRNGQVSAERRSEALVKTGRLPEAQTRIFQQVDGAPDNDDRHESMVELLMRDRPGIGAETIYSDLDSLKYTKSTLFGSVPLSHRWSLELEATHREQRSTDRKQLAWVPGRDQSARLTLNNVTPDRRFSLAVGTRSAVNTFQTVALQASFNRQGKLRPSIELGINQFTDLSQALQVAGVKDVAKATLQWDANRRWFAWAGIEASHIRDQKRHRIGRGLELTGDLGYRLTHAYPDLSLRLTASRGIYSARNRDIHTFKKLLPSDASLAASSIVPRNFTQYGLMLSFGTSDRDVWSHRWRPFMDAGYVHDSHEGWGPAVDVGIGGSVIGADHLRFFYHHAAARRGDGQRTRRFGLSYQLYF